MTKTMIKKSLRAYISGDKNVLHTILTPHTYLPLLLPSFGRITAQKPRGGEGRPLGSTRRARRPLPPKKCVSLPNKGGQIKSTRQKWGQRSLPLDRTERCRSLGGAWVPRPDGRPALKNSLDYTAASIGSQCCILAEIFTLFRRFIGWKIENAKVDKIFLAIRWEMRYDRVDPPCGGLLFLAKNLPRQRHLATGGMLFTGRSAQSFSVPFGS